MATRIGERRGSPRRRQQSLIFTSLWVALFPFVWFTLQWRNDVVYTRRDIGFWPAVSTVKDDDESDGDDKDRFYPTRRAEPSAPVRIADAAAATKLQQQSEPAPTKTTRPPPESLILNPQDHPILLHPELYSSSRPYPVSFLGNDENFYQTLEESPRIQICSKRIWGGIHEPPQDITMDPSCQPELLIVDWSGLDRDCHTLRDTDPNIPLLLYDASASAVVVDCPTLDRTVYTAKRSIVEQRWWKFDERNIHTGNVMQRAVYHIPGCVTYSPIKTKETIEVLHYWNSITAATDIPARQYSEWRAQVSRQIQSTKRSLLKKGHDRTWVDHFGLIADDEHDALTPDELRSDLAKSLASAKIVVVTQSDEYEDHDDRLMEALASGALVLTDAMLAPPLGLRNETNIVFFDSRKSLDRLLRYYLTHDTERRAIAKRGRSFAVEHHRCWQVMESVLFGTHGAVRT